MIKKLAFIYLALGFASVVWASPIHDRSIEATGEVLSVSPVYSRITIKHGLIPGYSESGETEFQAEPKEILSKISGGDLVQFTITETKGNSVITKIERTGVAVKEERHLGQALQKTLEGAGDAATALVSPIAPAGEVVGAATTATTEATSSVLNQANPEVKQSF